MNKRQVTSVRSARRRERLRYHLTTVALVLGVLAVLALLVFLLYGMLLSGALVEGVGQGRASDD